MALDSGGHYETEGEGGKTTDLAITMSLLLEEEGLFVDSLLELWIFELKVFVFEGLLGPDSDQIFFEGIFELVDDLLKEFFIGCAMGLQHLVPGNEAEESLCLISVLFLDLG